jgi:hypothetical protein
LLADFFELTSLDTNVGDHIVIVDHHSSLFARASRLR